MAVIAIDRAIYRCYSIVLCTYVSMLGLPAVARLHLFSVRLSVEVSNSQTQEAQLSLSDRAMRLVSSNIANYHATVQKLLIRQVLTKPMV